MNKQFTIDDLDLLIWDWTIITLPIVLDEHKLAILGIAHKLLSQNFFTTDPVSSLCNWLRDYGYIVSRGTSKELIGGWKRISKEFCEGIINDRTTGQNNE